MNTWSASPVAVRLTNTGRARSAGTTLGTRRLLRAWTRTAWPNRLADLLQWPPRILRREPARSIARASRPARRCGQGRRMPPAVRAWHVMEGGPAHRRDTRPHMDQAVPLTVNAPAIPFMRGAVWSARLTGAEREMVVSGPGWPGR